LSGTAEVSHYQPSYCLTKLSLLSPKDCSSSSNSSLWSQCSLPCHYLLSQKNPPSPFPSFFFSFQKLRHIQASCCSVLHPASPSNFSSFPPFGASMQLHSSSSFAPPSLLHTHSHKRPMHSHAAVMEKNIRRQNQDGLNIPKHTLNAWVFTQCGNPLWCDICNPSLLRQLSPSASSSLVEHKRFGGLDETSPIGDHRHPVRCIINSLLQNRGCPSHLNVR